MHMHVLHKVEATYPRHCLETNRKPMANKIQTRVNGELATRSEKLSTSNEINRLLLVALSLLVVLSHAFLLLVTLSLLVSLLHHI